MTVNTVLLSLSGNTSEEYKTPRMLSFRVADKSNPLNALFVQFPVPLGNFSDKMIYLARCEFKNKRISQLSTATGLRPRQVANLTSDGSINGFAPFSREYTTFLASCYDLATPLYRQHGVENFFVDIAQSERFSTLYHRCNVVFAPLDYDSELLSGAGVLPYFHAAGDEFSGLVIGKRISLIRNLFEIVDIFQDINDKKVYVIRRLQQPSD